MKDSKRKIIERHVEIGDKVHVLTIGDKWCVGTVTSISTKCEHIEYTKPIIWVGSICGEGEALFYEHELELRGSEWWEKNEEIEGLKE